MAAAGPAVAALPAVTIPDAATSRELTPEHAFAAVAAPAAPLAPTEIPTPADPFPLPYIAGPEQVDAMYAAARERAATFVREHSRELKSYHQSGIDDAVRARLLVEFVLTRETLTDIETAALVDAAFLHAKVNRAQDSLTVARDEGDWFEQTRRRVERTPQMLLTVPLHLLLLLLIGGVIFLTRPAPRVLHIPIEMAFAPGEGEQLDNVPGEVKEDNTELAPDKEEAEPEPSVEPEEPVDPVVPEEVTENDAEPTDPTDVRGEQADGDLAANSNPIGAAGTDATSDGADTGTAGGAMANRTGSGRDEALKRNGGSEATENAVYGGLQWLSLHQENNGSWAVAGYHKHCVDGRPCGAELDDNWVVQPSDDYGLTALCLLAYTGAGYTHNGGSEFAPVVEKAAKYLLSYRHRRNGTLGIAGQWEFGYPAYDHSIALLALCELRVLSGDASLDPVIVKALEKTVNSQTKRGGWAYELRPGEQRSDLSITVWMVMALKAAQTAGFEVNEACLTNAAKYVDESFLASGVGIYADAGYGKNRGGIGMTAVASLGSLYLGMDKTDQRLTEAKRRMLLDLPDYPKLAQGNIRDETDELKFHTEYYWYYGSLALFQMGGRAWEVWNDALKTALIPTQAKEGCERGSWPPVEAWLGVQYGRIYTTAMNTLNLEVYYRYARIQKGLKPLPAAGSTPAAGSGTPPAAPLVPATPAEPTPDEAVFLVDLGETRERTKALRIVDASGTREQRVRAVQKALKANDVLCASNALNMVDRHKLWEAADELMIAYRNPAFDGMQHMILGTLGRLGADAISAVPFLIEGPLRDKDDLIATAAAGALKKITGQQFGTNLADWRRWWANRPKK